VLALGDDLGEVQEGAGNGGAWDVVDLGDVVIGERRRAVDEMPSWFRRERRGT
jgi:hypothetical protein